MQARLSLLLVLLWSCSCSSLSAPTAAPNNNHVFLKYFAIGSNMLPSTMTVLRQIPVGDRGSAGILPDYRLAMNVPGIPFVTGSSASAQSSPGDLLHGVLYDLTLDQFARVGTTEGVPFAYVWKRCSVIPYVGNGDCAGQDAYVGANAVAPVEAFVLQATNSPRNGDTIDFDTDDSPTSPWYLKILQQGAVHWGLDRSYQIGVLGKIRTTQNLLVPDRLTDCVLQTILQSGDNNESSGQEMRRK
jgi:hypothetical protein